MTPQLAYSILNPLTDGQDVPLTVSLSLMCELIDAANIPLDRKHAVIEQIKGNLDRKTPAGFNSEYPQDKNGKPIDLQDYVASEVVGVQIGSEGHKLWVCIDGVAVLRVKAPVIDLEDMRTQLKDEGPDEDSIIGDMGDQLRKETK